MNYKTVLRWISGWFVVCVWIVGVPHVLKLSFIGVRSAGQEAVCLVTNCSEKGETIATLSQEEFDDLMSLKKKSR